MMGRMGLVVLWMMGFAYAPLVQAQRVAVNRLLLEGVLTQSKVSPKDMRKFRAKAFGSKDLNGSIADRLKRQARRKEAEKKSALSKKESGKTYPPALSSFH
jgi:hypothetical protein